jgi:hypothetical protein
LLSNKRTWRGRLQAIKFLLGLALLIFAGYAVGLRSQRLDGGGSVRVLGESDLLTGRAVAFRVIGLTAGGGDLKLSSVDLELLRPGRQLALARRLGHGPVMDLDVTLPVWEPGPASLRVRAVSEAGQAVLQVPVRILAAGPGPSGAKPQALTLNGPSAEWVGSSSWELRLADEPIPEGAPGPPVALQFYPEGGRLAGPSGARVLVRAVDRAGRSVPGQLSVESRAPVSSDADGLMMIQRAHGARGLAVSFAGPSGSVAGRVDLLRDEAVFDLALRPLRVVAGRTVELQVRASVPAGELFYDLWWTGGWCGGGQTKLEGGRAAAVIRVPASVQGPLVIQLRDDPLGARAGPMRQGVVWVGQDSLPSVSETFLGLTRLTPDGSFWAESSGLLVGGRSSLSALLSRVRVRRSDLPQLMDSRRQGIAFVAPGRSPTGVFAVWVSGVSSGLFFLVFAWTLLVGMRGGSLWGRVAWISALGAGLLGGWVWLYFNCL